MTSSDFTTKTHGKWILAGEHAVLRQSPAIVFPIPTKSLTLDYWDHRAASTAEFSGQYDKDTHLLFWSVLEHGLECVKHSISDISGKFHIQNDIPLGAGLGGSAALCAALARWFAWKALIASNQIYDFARRLEDLFHNESSGIDIAGASSESGVFFTKGKKVEAIILRWQPHWYLSDTEQVGITSHCVKKVKEMFVQNPDLANRIDNEMAHSVIEAKAALEMPEKEGLAKLAASINQAHVCFSQWGLAGGKVEQHINQLLAAGALAAKPTGSGDGGHILSLWDKPVDAELPFSMFRV